MVEIRACGEMNWGKKGPKNSIPKVGDKPIGCAIDMLGVLLGGTLFLIPSIIFTYMSLIDEEFG